MTRILDNKIYQWDYQSSSGFYLVGGGKGKKRKREVGREENEKDIVYKITPTDLNKIHMWLSHQVSTTDENF